MICASALSLGEFLERVYLPEHLGMKAVSAEQLRCSVALFERWAGGRVTLAELHRSAIVGFLHAYLSTGRAMATVNSKRRALLTVWRFAIELGFCDASPGRIPCVREPRREPFAWVAPELERLWRAICEMPGWYRTPEWEVRRSHAWQIAYALILDTGVRRRALLLARREQLEREECLLHVPAEHLKGEAADSCYPIGADLVRLIDALPPACPLVFPFPLGTTALRKHYRAILARAGLPLGRKYMLHCLRKTAESHAAAAVGVDRAAAMIGHSSEVARRHYVSPRVVRPAGICDYVPRPQVDCSRQLRLF